MRIALFFAAALFTTLATAQSRPGQITVHPTVVQRGSPFLLLAEGATGGCPVRIQASATASQIVVRALDTAVPGFNCIAAISPFAEIVDPRDLLAANVAFSDTVEVRYEYVSDNGVMPIQNTTVRFSAERAPTLAFASGSFKTRFLDKSGLFIDHQGSALSATLANYDAARNSLWWAGAGAVYGNVFTGEIVTFRGAQCVNASCLDRDRTGRIAMLFLDRDVLLVRYTQMFDIDDYYGDYIPTFEYRRLKLTP